MKQSPSKRIRDESAVPAKTSSKIPALPADDHKGSLAALDAASPERGKIIIAEYYHNKELNNNCRWQRSNPSSLASNTWRQRRRQQSSLSVRRTTQQGDMRSNQRGRYSWAEIFI
jgi:hypothetical protein